MTEENQKRRDFLKEIEAIVHETLDTLPVSDMACRVCRTPLDESSVHRMWFGGPGEAPTAVVLCKHCYDFATASIRFVRKEAQ